jgi:hypothetical protein
MKINTIIFIKKFLRLFYYIALSSIFTQQSFALDLESEGEREKLIGNNVRKINKNSKNNLTTFSLIGNYQSDYNSKSYEIGSRIFCKKPQYNLNIDISHSNNWADTGSGKKKIILAKKSELYDAQITSKILILQSPYYIATYNRGIYDDLSTYYYDSRHAIGFGKIFNNIIEVDLNIGKRYSKNFESATLLAPSFRLNWQINNLQFLNRSYFFTNREISDSESRSTIRYYIHKNLAIELNHDIDKRRYIDKKQIVNRIARKIQIGTTYRF